MAQKYSLGLDYGTNSVRALLVNTNNGREVTTYVHNYKRGVDGIILDRKNHNLARQDPQDYVESMEICIKQVINQTKKKIKNFSPGEIIGIGVDTTGSTPIPVDEKGQPLSFRKEFRNNPNAMAWLWKDHTGYEEAEEITELAKKRNEPYLAKCGGVYSSEWFFSKILHC